MSNLLQHCTLKKWPFFLVAFGVFSITAFGGEIPALLLEVHDTADYTGQHDVALQIRLNNYMDTVSAFKMWLQLDRPDLAAFSTHSAIVVDTTYWKCTETSGPNCIDSVLWILGGDWDFMHIDTSDVIAGELDTAGTLCSGWQSVKARSLSGSGFDLDLTGVADRPQWPYIPGIPPQQGGTLINLFMDLFKPPDTVCEAQVVNILLSPEYFIDPYGDYIAVDSLLDTTCYICGQWIDSICLYWEVTWPPPCDSITTRWVYVLDTSRVFVVDGSVIVYPDLVSGDCDGDHDADVADLTCLIWWFFQGGQAHQCVEVTMNVDGADGINIADVTYLVNYLFKGGPAPVPCF